MERLLRIEKSEMDFLWHKLKQIFTFGVRPMHLDVQLQQKSHSKWPSGNRVYCKEKKFEKRKTRPNKIVQFLGSTKTGLDVYASTQ